MKLNRKLDLRKIGNKYMIVNGDAGNVDMVRVKQFYYRFAG